MCSPQPVREWWAGIRSWVSTGRYNSAYAGCSEPRSFPNASSKGSQKGEANSDCERVRKRIGLYLVSESVSVEYFGRVGPSTKTMNCRFAALNMGSNPLNSEMSKNLP